MKKKDAEILKLIAEAKKEKEALEAKEVKKDAWMCKDDPKKFCRKLTDDEGKCYWILQTENAKDFSAQGLELNAVNASFSWNYEANSADAIEGKTACKQFPSTMKPPAKAAPKKLSPAEALKKMLEDKVNGKKPAASDAAAKAKKEGTDMVNALLKKMGRDPIKMILLI